jgi:hypothetical protein
MLLKFNLFEYIESLGLIATLSVVCFRPDCSLIRGLYVMYYEREIDCYSYKINI